MLPYRRYQSFLTLLLSPKHISMRFNLPKRLRKRPRRKDFLEALISLERACQVEAARQERERVIECARMLALHEREVTLRSSPFVWPATMVREMPSHYSYALGDRSQTVA